MGELTTARRLTAILFPERCVGCDCVIVPGADLCEDCQKKLPCIEAPVCPFCGLPKEYCRCRKRRRQYERVVAPFLYDGVVQKGILRMKQTGNRLSAAYFAEHMANTVRQYYDETTFDAVVYVPSHPKKERIRGFNAGKMIAADMAKELGLPMWDVLAKIVDNPVQKSLDASVRSGNVLGVFDILSGYDLKEKTLLLADDVVTTGATLNECAKMLKLYGAKAVYGVAAAITALEPNKGFDKK